MIERSSRAGNCVSRFYEKTSLGKAEITDFRSLCRSPLKLALFALAKFSGRATMSAGCTPQPFGLRLLLLATHHSSLKVKIGKTTLK
ncbi:MAG: hypothetical protein FWE67_06200 [Planctomycetaceae bacterium]|nr:hypothetical protein [Planctomycetaceae bacterium]